MTPIQKISIGLLLLIGMILASPLHPAFAGNGVVVEKQGVVKVLAARSTPRSPCPAPRLAPAAPIT